MIIYSKDEKCAMMLALTQIGAINDDRKYARTSIMLRFQDMLGVDTFDLREFSNTKADRCFSILKGMSIEKKKHFLLMMLKLIYEDGKMVESERKALTVLGVACDISCDVVNQVVEDFRRK